LYHVIKVADAPVPQESRSSYLWITSILQRP